VCHLRCHDLVSIRSRVATDLIHAACACSQAAVPTLRQSTALRSFCQPSVIVHASALQEILLILEEYWARNPQLQAVPIYQASGLAAKAMTIYQTYIEMMNEDIRKAFQVRSGFGLGSGSRVS